MMHLITKRMYILEAKWYWLYNYCIILIKPKHKSFIGLYDIQGNFALLG